MKILPGRGTDAIDLRADPKMVLSRLGEPAAKTGYGEQPGYPKDRENWDYGGFSILVTPRDGVVSISIDQTMAEVTLWDRKIFACTPDQLVEMIAARNHRPEIGDKTGDDDFDITVGELGLIFYCSGEEVVGVEVNALDWREAATDQ